MASTRSSVGTAGCNVEETIVGVFRRLGATPQIPGPLTLFLMPAGINHPLRLGEEKEP